MVEKIFSCTNSWSFTSGLGSSLFCQKFGKELTVFNIYGPYTERLENGCGVFRMGWLYQGLATVAGGDVNLSLGAAEIWGDAAVIDGLSDYFKTLFGRSRVA